MYTMALVTMGLADLTTPTGVAILSAYGHRTLLFTLLKGLFKYASFCR